jgi:penicillin-binding protein 2
MRIGVRSIEEPIDSRNAYRFGVFAIVIAIVMASLGARMVYVALLFDPGQGGGVITNQTTAIESIPSTRGLIYDSQKRPLVNNVVSYDVIVTPADLPRDQEQIVATRLSPLLGLDMVDIETQIDSATGSLYTPIKIASGIDVQSARFIEENADALPGVKVVTTTKREYLTHDLFAGIIGYNGRITEQQYNAMKSQGYSNSDIIGQAGLEAYYEQTLRGTPGQQTVALDETGKAIPGLVTPGRDPVPGASLYLTVDQTEQEKAQKALQWGLSASHVSQGVIIVMNPQNGAILAMVSWPTYDDQLFADGISETTFQELLNNPNQPLLNKAVAGQYAPGSTYKLVTATAGLQGCNGVPADSQPADKAGDPAGTRCAQAIITPQTELLSQPYIQVGDYKFPEWDNNGWGWLNVTQAVAHSSDTFFYQLATRVGIDLLAFWAHQYGFGEKTGIDLPSEAAGIVPTQEWKIKNFGEQMWTGDIMHAGIGQGDDNSTPLQLLNAYCALANGGNLWRPHVVAAITDASGTPQAVQPTLIRKLAASDSTLTTLRLATRQVVTSRHTLNLADLEIKVAGKTGTAEFSVPDERGRLPYSSWFVGYTEGDGYVDDFTRTDSQLAVLAYVYGGNTQGNVATEIVKYYMMLHYKLKGDPFSNNTWGHINTWTAHRGNFYGLNHD